MDLRYGDASVGASVDLRLASQADDHAYVRIRPEDVHEVAGPEVATGTLDAEGRLVVSGDRLVGLRTAQGYEPRYLVSSDRAGDGRLLEELEAVDEAGPMLGGEADAAVRRVEGAGVWTHRLLAANAALSALVVLAVISAGVRGEETEATLDLLFLVGGLQSLVLVATVVSWCMWQYRAHRTAQDALGVKGMRTVGWAIGSWFIPFVNLVVPYRAIRDLWKASDPEAGRAGWVSLDAPSTLGWWWAAWLSSRFLTAVAVQLGDPGFRLTVLSELLSIAAAVLAMRIVEGIGDRLRVKLGAAG